MTVDRVLLVEPRSFCAGVETAIKTLAWMVVLHHEPVFCVHEIVHNDAVVRRFERLGVVFVDEVSDVPPGRPVVLSAHGSAPAAVSVANQRASVVVDAICPLVAKVHREVRLRAAAGDTIIYVGHAGHDETEAVRAIAPDATRLVTTPADVATVGAIPGGVSLLAQTTLSMDRLDAVERAVHATYGAVWTPRRADLCYATTNRQQALRAACARADAVVVVGSRTSANTMAMVALAQTCGTPVVRVDDADELPPAIGGVAAVTAGASAPEDAVARVVSALAPAHGVERFAPVNEDEYFPLPPALRPLLAAAGQRITGTLRTMLDNDRTTPALALLSAVEAAYGSDGAGVRSEVLSHPVP